jgi:hypothetical protein
VGSTDDFRADGNGDGVIDAADYGVWRSNFGAMVASPGAGTVLSAFASSDLSEEAAAIDMARFNSLEASFRSTNFDLEKSWQRNPYRSAAADGDDLLLLASNRIQNPARPRSESPEIRLNQGHRGDEDRRIADEALAVVLAAWP